MPPPEPIRASWNGIACGVVSASRTSGLVSDSYAVVLGWDAAASPDLDISPPDPMFPDLGRQDGDPREGLDTAKRLIDGPVSSFGDLVMEWPDKPGSIVRAEGLYVRPDGITVKERSRGVGPGDAQVEHLVELQLVDIRYFWATRGVVFGDFNVVNRKVNDYYPVTLAGGQPYILKDMISLLLNALPGRCPLSADFPERIETSIEPRNLTYRFDSPLAQLAFLLDEHNLVPSLLLDNSFQVSEIGRGAEGFGVLNQNPIPDELVRERVTVRGPAYPPDEVLVAGAPNIRTAENIPCEPVGIAVDGSIQPLEAAIKSYDESLEVADIEVCLLRGDPMAVRYLTGRKNLTRAAAESILGWAGRLFRIEGVESAANHLVPILDRAEVNEETGERLEPLVQARSWIDQRLTRDEIKAGGIYPEEELKDGELAAAMADVTSLINGGRTIESVAPEVFSRRGGSVVFSFQPLVDHDVYKRRIEMMEEEGEGRVAVGQVVVTGQNRERQVFIIEALDGKYEAHMWLRAPDEEGKLLIAPISPGKIAGRMEDRAAVVYVNQPRHFIDPDAYELDRERGIIKFSRPMGLIADPKPGIQVDRLIIGDAGVVITYGVSAKPNLLVRAAKRNDYWHRAFRLNYESGKMEALREAKQGRFPRPLYDPSLQELTRADGSSNVAELEFEAARRALDAFGRFRQHEDTFVKVGGVFPVETNGNVLSVSWTVDAAANEASTSYRIGSFRGINPGDAVRGPRPVTQLGRRDGGVGARVSDVQGNEIRQGELRAARSRTGGDG